MDRPRRLRPAAVAGLGAGGSLGAAAVCILALGITSVAFVPWAPRPRFTEPSPPQVTLRAPPPERQVTPRGPRPAGPQPTAAATPAPQRTRAPGARIERRARRRPRPPATAPPAPAPEPAPAPSPPPRPASPPPDPPPTLLRDRVAAAAGQARALGEQAATTVSQVDPQAGALVAETTGAVASAVEDVATRLP